MLLIKDVKELEKLLNVKLTKKQRKIFSRRERFLMYGGSLSSGKSFLLAFMALYYALRFNGAVCLIGRKFHTSITKTTQISFEYLLKKLPKGYLIRHDKTEGYFEFKNGSRIYFVGLADSFESLDKIRGMELLFAAIDEAQDLDTSEAFKTLSTRLRQKIKGAEPKLLLTSNPSRKKWIRELFVDHKRRDFYFLRALPKDNPHLPKDYIKNQKKVLSDIEFKILIGGSWKDAQVEDCLFDKKKIEEAVKNKRHVKGGVSYGIDVSFSGTTVMAKKLGNIITLPIVLKNTDIDKLIEKIGKAVKNKSVPIYVDAIGEGAGLAVILEREKYNVIRVRQNEQATDYDKYFNQRVENYDRVNQLLDEGLNLPNDIELINQMLMTKKDFSKDNRIKIESKKALHDRKQSPDKLDAVCLSCIGGGIIEEEDESELIMSLSQLKLLEHNLLKLEKGMTDIEKNKMITYIEADEKRHIEQGGIKPDWREYRKEYDRLIQLYNRFTNKGWYHRNTWMLNKPMEYEYDHIVRYKYSDEDNPNINVNLNLPGKGINSYAEKVTPRGYGGTSYGSGSNGGIVITSEEIFGKGDIPDYGGDE